MIIIIIIITIILWNMKVTVIPIVTGVLGTISEGLIKLLEE